MRPLQVAFLFAGAAASAAAQDEPRATFESNPVEIHFGLSVTTGAAVEKLEKEDLRIEDNGHFYSALDVALLSEPGRFIFVVDTSESLEAKVAAIRDAVMALANRLG